MKNSSASRQRRSIRLKTYDYSQSGWYFITICTQNHRCLFGKIIEDEMHLNSAGYMLQKEWMELPLRFNTIQLHEYIVMPNHFHGIIEIVGAPLVGARPETSILTSDKVKYGEGQPQGIAPTIGNIVGRFKSITTNQYIRGVKDQQWQAFIGKLWQRNYYEHIIRNEPAYLNIADYIQTNPQKWQQDIYYVG